MDQIKKKAEQAKPLILLPISFKLAQHPISFKLTAYWIRFKLIANWISLGLTQQQASLNLAAPFKVFTQTLFSTHSDKKRNRQSGMTLIEIMIVLVIVAFASAQILPRLSNKNNEFRKLTRRFVVMGKQLQTLARIQQKTFRIVIEMPEKGPHSYWVESSSGPVVLDYEELKEKNEEFTRLSDEEKVEKGSDGFSIDTSVFKSPQVLPEPLKFQDAELGMIEEKVSEGRAYIHFFPEGMVEEVAIHITDGDKLNWTIVYNPLTGKGQILSNYVSLRDIRGK